jgi:hypothetical protein
VKDVVVGVVVVEGEEGGDVIEKMSSLWRLGSTSDHDETFKVKYIV